MTRPLLGYRLLGIAGLLVGGLGMWYQLQSPTPLRLAWHTFTAQSIVEPNADRQESDYPILAQCSGYEEADIFAEYALEFAQSATGDTVDRWSNMYHTTVKEIVDDYLDPTQQEYNCTSENVTGVLEPPDSLRRLARRLPPWRTFAQDLEQLSRHDLAPVLLEWLRVYECASAERNSYLFRDVGGELAQQTGEDTILRYELTREHLEQRQKIEQELRTARQTLNRTLSLLGGFERSSQLDAEVVCLQRTLTDVRNGMALGAEAAACLPRLWNARDVLRDLPTTR